MGCSCDSVRCRFRCLKCSGVMLITLGVIYFGCGVIFNFIDFLKIFTTGHSLVWSGSAMFMAGVASIFIAKTMSDDDWSSRGTAFMCLLAIGCALGNVAVHTFVLYDSEYFQEYDADTFIAQNLTFNLTYERWLGVIIVDGGIDFIAALTTLFGLAAFGIGCCCLEYSEIVDDVGKGRYY